MAWVTQVHGSDVVVVGRTGAADGTGRRLSQPRRARRPGHGVARHRPLRPDRRLRPGRPGQPGRGLRRRPRRLAGPGGRRGRGGGGRHAGPGGDRGDGGARAVHPRPRATSSPRPTSTRSRPPTGDRRWAPRRTAGRRSTWWPAWPRGGRPAPAPGWSTASTVCTACGSGSVLPPGPRRRRAPGAAGVVARHRGPGREPDGRPFPGFEERLAAIRARIEAASPDPSAVTLVAVTKGFGPEARAHGPGVRTDRASGRTTPTSWWPRRPRWPTTRDRRPSGTSSGPSSATRCPAWPRWWRAGRRWAAIEEGRAIARRRPGARVLVQVDVAGLPGRGGVPPAERARAGGRPARRGPGRGRTDGRRACPGLPKGPVRASGRSAGWPTTWPCRSGRWA